MGFLEKLWRNEKKAEAEAELLSKPPTLAEHMNKSGMKFPKIGDQQQFAVQKGGKWVTVSPYKFLNGYAEALKTWANSEEALKNPEVSIKHMEKAKETLSNFVAKNKNLFKLTDADVKALSNSIAVEKSEDKEIKYSSKRARENLSVVARSLSGATRVLMSEALGHPEVTAKTFEKAQAYLTPTPEKLLGRPQYQAVVTIGGEIVRKDGKVESDVPGASTLKMVGLISAMQLIRDGKMTLDDVIVYDKKHADANSRSQQTGFKDGTKMTVLEAMFSSGGSSDNNTTRALVAHMSKVLGGDGTVEDWVKRQGNPILRQIGANNTVIDDPTGLDPAKARTTAVDIAKINAAADRNFRTEFLEIFAEKHKIIGGMRVDSHSLGLQNQVGKTGSLGRIMFDGNPEHRGMYNRVGVGRTPTGQEIVVAVMGAANRKDAVTGLANDPEIVVRNVYDKLMKVYSGERLPPEFTLPNGKKMSPEQKAEYLEKYRENLARTQNDTGGQKLAVGELPHIDKLLEQRMTRRLGNELTASLQEPVTVRKPSTRMVASAH